MSSPASPPPTNGPAPARLAPAVSEDHVPSPAELLIQAVEAGDVAGVRAALEAGGSPDARKTLALRVKLETDSGGEEDVRDEEKGESALALAIRDGREDLVEALLNAGADPNLSISWRFPFSWPSWTPDRWKSSRWHKSPGWEFQSALSLALTTGPCAFSRPGSTVLFDEPRGPQYVSHTLTPNLSIVCMLLDKGAAVTDQVLARAAGIRDARFAKLVRERAAVAAAAATAAAASASRPGTPSIKLSNGGASGRASPAGSLSLSMSAVGGGPSSPALSSARSRSGSALAAGPAPGEDELTWLRRRVGELEVINVDLTRVNADLQRVLRDKTARVAELEREARAGGWMSWITG